MSPNSALVQVDRDAIEPGKLLEMPLVELLEGCYPADIWRCVHEQMATEIQKRVETEEWHNQHCADQAWSRSWRWGCNPTRPPPASVTHFLTSPRLPVVSTWVRKDLETGLTLSEPQKEATELKGRTGLGKRRSIF